MKKIAIIGSGILSKEIAERAKELDVESHCFSFNENDIACNSVDFFHKVNIFDIDEIVRICKCENINGVIPTTELTILPAAQIAQRLGLLGNSVEVARDITNKYLTREKVKNVVGLYQPNYTLYTNGSYPVVNNFPVIVKPIAAGGKRGVTVVYNQNEMEKAIEDALPFSKVKGVLIEEYLKGGTEYSVETLSYKSIHYVTQITEKDTSGPPRCNELGHHQPANLSEDIRQKVKSVISNMLNVVGVSNGPSHIEIKIIDGKIYLIEINDRPGGDHITYPLTELSTGYPYLSGIIYASMGMLEGKEPVDLKSYYAGILFLTDKTPELKQIYADCEKFSWFFDKNYVNEGVSKIEFNDEDGLNYFIYWDKENNPMPFIRNYRKNEKMTVYTVEQCEKWDTVVRSFKAYDVYWLSGYVKAFQIHGDGEPLLFYYESENTRGINVVMKRDIARDPHFVGILPENTYFDFSTPYGYGGWLIEGEIVAPLFAEYENWCKSNGIISEFVRFHPVIHNHINAENSYEIVRLGEVVTMDISSPEVIWNNLTSKNRNVIRKAQKSGVQIYNGRDPEVFRRFMNIYSGTMNKDHAIDYYYFDNAFYDSVLNDLPNHAQVFYAVYQNETIAAAIIISANGRMNYHLSGSLREYSNLAATNLLLYKAALWGCDNGYKTFYLGGGVGSTHDSLFSFKKAFYRGDDLNSFFIGKKVFDQLSYDNLLKMRNANEENGFFPNYRA